MGVANISGNILTDSGASLSSYLPLTGGTLTGALSGTSATFSDLVTTTSVYRIVQASASRGGLYTYNQVAGSGTDYSLGIASEGEAFITTGGTATKRLVVTSGGNVGIGTTSPSSQLSIVGAGSDIFADGLRVTRTSGTNQYGVINYKGGSLNLLAVDPVGSSPEINFLTSTNGSTSSVRMVILSSGNVGIGTTNPVEALQVTGNIRVSNRYYINDGTNSLELGANYIQAYLNSGAASTNLSFYTGTAERLKIASDGTLIKSGDSSSMRVLPSTDNVGYVGESSKRWAAIYAANGTIQTSDGREKKDITNSDLGLDFITSLRPVSFKWIVGENIVTYETITNGNGEEEIKEIVTPREGKRTHYGFIAQEVKEVLADKDFGGFVHDIETDKMSLRYDQFISPLVKAIQEQQEIINQLLAKVTALENK